MKKKLMAITLGALLILGLFSGCAGGGGGTASGSASSGSASAIPSGDVVAKRIENAKKTGKYQTVVMNIMNFTGPTKGVKDVQDAINKITEKKLGIDVQLNFTDGGSYSQQLTLSLSSGEPVDIYNAMLPGYSSVINSGYTLDLEKDNLISTYGVDILKTFDKSIIDACRVGGVLYGLPQQRDFAIGHDCMVIPAKYLDDIGYDYNSQLKSGEEVIHTNINTINDIFAKLHAKYPDKTVTLPAITVFQRLEVDNLGSSTDVFGVLLNKGQDLTVKDLFTSDEYMNLCKRYYQWNQAGYISKDAMTNKAANSDQIKAGTAMSYTLGGKPGIRAQETRSSGQDMVIFQMGDDFLRSTAVTTMPWCINAGSKDPIAAMQFLNLAYSDPDISNLLCWGIEGKEYKATSDGHIDFADGVDGTTSPYFMNVTWEMPNQYIAKIWAGNNLNIWENTKKFNSNAITSKALGFVFDNSSVATEFTALSNIYLQYQNQLELGFTDPKVGIPEMEAKLKAAGLDKYMQAKQAQLDSWAKAKK